MNVLLRSARRFAFRPSLVRNLCTLERDDATRELLKAKRDRKLTFEEIGKQIGCDKVWTASAILGQHKFSPDEVEKLVNSLGLAKHPYVGEMKKILTEIPVRYGHDDYSDDPTVYRLEEIVKLYGPSIKLLIHEMFGDGIMSAVDCRIDISKKKGDEGEERVVLTIDGKFLKYRKW